MLDFAELKMVFRSVFRLVFLFIFMLKSIQAYTPRDLTIKIPAGAVECFYQTVKDEKTLDLVYQVNCILVE